MESQYLLANNDTTEATAIKFKLFKAVLIRIGNA